MTILCQGILDARINALHKVGSPKPRGHTNHRVAWLEAQVLILSVIQKHAGQCHRYSYTSTGWSDHRDIQEMAVTSEETVKVSGQRCAL